MERVDIQAERGGCDDLHGIFSHGVDQWEVKVRGCSRTDFLGFDETSQIICTPKIKEFKLFAFQILQYTDIIKSILKFR